MSEYAIKIGKLIPIPIEGTLEKTASKILSKYNRGIDFYDDPVYELQTHCSDKYFIDEINNKMFKIENENYDEYADIYYARENGDGSIDYVLEYYNGVCCFEEAMNEAMKKLKKDN